MVDSVTNGAVNGDTEMADSVAQETPLDPSLQNGASNLADPTDPQPPPAPVDSSITQPVVAEHLSTITPAANVPPAAQTPPVAVPTTSSRTGSAPPQSKQPEKAVSHGGPTRQYLNTNVTPHLLEGMKALAMQEPDKPLLWLSEFLKERSAEVE